MIRLRQIAVTYRTRQGPRPILRGVDLDLARGEKLGILGRNGAGKSTLVRVVSGAERATSGHVERTMSVSWPLAFAGAFQASLTGRDNVRFISRIYHSDFRRNIAAVEDFAELGAYLNEPVRTYSSGMRARLAFAISLIIEFDCFLIDEVAAVGDARFRQKCEHELFHRRADRAMIMVSHENEYIRNHCNRFAVLEGGMLHPFNSFDEAHDALAAIMAWQPPVDPVSPEWSIDAQTIA